MINYNILAKSVSFFEDHGFNQIETPWVVSKYIDSLTKPTDKKSFELKHNKKCLVASGEQSFLYLYLKECLPKGQFQTITPCFRDDEDDYLHSKHFMKNELIKTDVVNSDELFNIVLTALEFFRIYLPDASYITTEDGFDIVCGDDELGSYGIRETIFLKWIYATGCAEPRLSKIMKKHGLS